MSKTHNPKAKRRMERRRGRIDATRREFAPVDQPSRGPHYKSLFILFFISGSLLRILLCWSNPPGNFFDNHFDPILLIMKTGAIPDKDACWQCYHPPVFYWISAMAGNVAMHGMAKLSQLLKFFQFIVCFYGILTIGILYLILNKLPLSNFSRLLAFGTACFLPRHIYMAAINSNDTISYLFVALSIYLLLIAIERKFSFLLLLTASVVISVTLFTKYTSFVVLPVTMVVFVLLLYKRLFASRKQALIFFVLIILMPATILGAYAISNIKHYDSAFPWNVKQIDPSLIQPRDSSHFNFFTFEPWESIDPPIIVPGRMHSFWTLVYSGTWFDNEPKFLYFLVTDQSWWDHYYAWLRGEERFPEGSPTISGLTKFIGAGLALLGLFPLSLIVAGAGKVFIGSWRRRASAEELAKMSMFATLLLSNAVVMVALALRLPVYSAAKASYFLNSLPAFVVFLGFGLMTCEKSKPLKWTMTAAFSLLFFFVSAHILHIVLSISYLKPANLSG